MIIERRNGKDIFSGNHKHIVFAVNSEGINDAGFAGKIARMFWPELAHIGECRLGTCLTKENNGVYYHALVCHSLQNGWGDSREIIKSCFDAIETDDEDEVASIAIGSGIIGILSGANFDEIVSGMEASSKKIILY